MLMSFIRNFFWNEAESRLRAGWRLLLLLALNLGLYLVLLSLVSQLNSPAAQSPWAEAILALLAVGITLFSVWFAGQYLDRRHFSDFGLHLRRKDWWSDFGFGLLIGVGIPIVFGLLCHAVGWIGLELRFPMGINLAPFISAVSILAVAYLCVGIFEESARAYHLRNIFEGTKKLGLLGAMATALIGASTISLVMHSGNALFLSFVFIATLIKGLSYFLTGRVAIALAQHAAWDFTMGVIFGFGVQEGSFVDITILHVQYKNAAHGPLNANEFAPGILLAMLVMELLSLSLILGWIRWRYGRVRLGEELAEPFWRYASSAATQSR